MKQMLVGMPIVALGEVGLWADVKPIALTLGVIIGAWLLVWLLNIVFRHKIVPYVLSKQTKWFRGLKIRSYEILNAASEMKVALLIVRLIRWLSIAAIISIALPLLFSIFPSTRRYALTLMEWVWQPMRRILVAVWDYVPSLLTIIVVALVVHYFLRSIKALALGIQNGKITLPGFYPDWAHTTYIIVRTVVYILAFIFVYPDLPGSDNKVFQGVSLFAGVIFSLGSTTVISNMMAGLVITYMRPFLKGDHVKIGQVTGDVLEKTPFVTRIKTYRQEIVTIPNAQILTGNVINYSISARVDGGVALATTITISYEVPWRQVHDMMVSAALGSSLILRTPAPYVIQTSLDDSYVRYELCAYTAQPAQQMVIYSELHQNLQDVFAQHGIEILSPAYRAERNGNASTVPQK
ncbi:MAG: mechanosensitive ion channel [Mucinivorans sp.]